MPQKRALLIVSGIAIFGCLTGTLFFPDSPRACVVCLADEAETKATGSNDNSSDKQPATAVIEGRVIYDADPKRRWRYSRYYINDRKKGELSEAVVGLRGKTLKNLPAPAKNKTWEMDQKNVRFTPETLAIRTGDRVKFTNSDKQVHNINTKSPLVRFDRTISSDQEAVETFQRAGGVKRPIVLGCKLHSAMQAWIYVFDHPFFQLTESDGKFRFENVPAGEYRVEMAHPAGGLQRTQRVKVKPGEHLELEIRVSPDHLVKS